jgi:hypothetical protein
LHALKMFDLGGQQPFECFGVSHHLGTEDKKRQFLENKMSFKLQEKM